MAEWLKKAIFYEVYPQSFKDSNGDGIGDIPGLMEKLDYIRELGMNAIWINPCFDSPFYDAGYDVADYYRVAPRYGTNEDLKRLFEKAHSYGMHVLLDLVPGHTAVTHPWFLESMKAEKNEYTDRYVWTDSPYKRMENVRGIVSILRGISPRYGTCGVNCFSTQPALNYGFARIDDPAWQQPVDAPGPRASREELMNIMRFWLGLGCDGFRVDMAGSLVKNDDDKTETIRLWQEVRAFLDREFPEAVLVSEWGRPEVSLKAGFHMDFFLHFGDTGYMDLFPTMKTLEPKRAENKAEKAAVNGSAEDATVSAPSVQIDLSKVKIEPLFADDVDFETFSKSDFRVVKIEACEAVPKSKKLLKFTLNDGTDRKRTILSGIHEYYEPEELVGKTCVAITNLPPRKMMGIDSEGMLISAVYEYDGREGLNLLMLDDSIPAGAKLY